MTPEQIELLAQQPGHEGAIYRLMKVWSTDHVGAWLQMESLRGTPVEDITKAFAEIIAGAAFGIAINTSAPDATIYGKNGILSAFQRSLQAKMQRRVQGAPGGFLMPANVNSKGGK